MFMDLKRSTEYLREHQQEYMFDEEAEENLKNQPYDRHAPGARMETE